MSESFEYYNAKKQTHNTHFDKYDGKMVLESKDPKTQNIFNQILSVFDKNKNQKLDADEIRTIWDNIREADTDKDGSITTSEIDKCIKNNKILAKLNLNAEDIMKFLKIADNTINKSFAKAKSNTEKRVIEDFKKKYPSNKYEIIIEEQEEDYSYIVIKDKKSGSKIITCNIFENGDYLINKGNDSYSYNKNGTLERYDKLDESDYTYKTGDPISDILHKDITAKTKLGFPTTGKDIEKHIKLITPKNILQVFDDYKNNYEEGLLEAIDDEWGLDEEIKKRIKEHLNKCLLKSDYWKYNKPNGKFDKEFNQGKTGDCWFLSAITAAAVKPKGLKILNNMIKENPDGSYTVKFKGADKAYTVTPIEIFGNTQLADGDLDARILELAAEKHFNILGINGGTVQGALDLLCGTHDKWKSLGKWLNPFDNNSTEELRRIIKDPNTIVTSGINAYLRVGMETEGKEYEEDIAWLHGYAVVDMDDEYVYLKNPWHTGDPTKKHTDKTFKLPISEFKRHFEDITYVTLE